MKNPITILLTILFSVTAFSLKAENKTVQEQSKAALLPDGNYKRNKGVWKIISGKNFILKIHQYGGGTIVIPSSGNFYLPGLHMRFNPHSGIMTVVSKKYESIKGEVKDIKGGQEAVVTAQSSNDLEVIWTYKVTGNTCEIRNSTKSNGLIVRGYKPIYLGGFIFVAKAPPIAFTSEREVTPGDKICEDAKSMEFESKGKIIKFEFGNDARIRIAPNSKNPNYYHINAFPNNVRTMIPPGGSIGYSIKITVKEQGTKKHEKE